MGVSAQTTTPVSAVAAGTNEFGAPNTTAKYTLLVPLPCVPGTGNDCAPKSYVNSVSIQSYIIYIYKIMVAIAVFGAVVMCIIGGFQYMLTDSFTKKGDARTTIENALLGLAGALLSYLILYTINPQLVNVSLVAVPQLNLKTIQINTNGPTDVSAYLAQQAAALHDQTISAQQQAKADQDQADAAYAAIPAGCIDGSGNQISNDPECVSAIQAFDAADIKAASSSNYEALTHGVNAFGQDLSLEQQQANQQGGDSPNLISMASSSNTSEYNTAMAKLKANNDIADQITLTAAYKAAQANIAAKQAAYNAAVTQTLRQSYGNMGVYIPAKK